MEPLRKRVCLVETILAIDHCVLAYQRQHPNNRHPERSEGSPREARPFVGNTGFPGGFTIDYRLTAVTESCVQVGAIL